MTKLQRYSYIQMAATRGKDSAPNLCKGDDVAALEAELATARTGLVEAALSMSELSAEYERLREAGANLADTMDATGTINGMNWAACLRAILNEQEKQP